MTGEYRTIVADPPWSYGRDDGRFPSAPGAKGNQRRVETSIGYETMTTPDIAALPISSLAASDCRLFLWATSKHLPDALAVCAAWGFEYRQALVWHKTGRATPFGGSVAPNHAEFCLVCACGSPPVAARWRSSVLSAPRAGKHSAKPEVFLDLVETVSPGPYVELFSRAETPRFAWDYWGDQSLGTAEMPELTVGEGMKPSSHPHGTGAKDTTATT